MLIYALNTVVILLQCILFFIGCYYFCISVFSLFPPKHTLADPENLRYAIVIPAHNEANCLPHLLHSLIQQSYPKERFAIFVVVDRCTDNTYEIVLNHNATPLLRKTPGEGKGAVLEDAFSQILSLPISYDGFVVLDADNVVDSRFLEELNHRMQQGNLAVQGYIDSKNPKENWISNAYSTWYWLSNRTIQMGFDRLGLGCKLGGTGFVLSRKLLEDVPWKTSTMAEDAEYTLLLALKNKKIAYAPRAVVYDEKPTDLSVSIKQRIRWTQGITQTQRDLCNKIIKQGKWVAFFRFWSDLLMPLCLILFFLLSIFSTANMLELATFPFVLLWSKPVPFILLNLYLWGTLFISVAGLYLDKKWDTRLLLNIFGCLLYLVTWIPAGIVGIFRHNDKTWYHTKHQSGT